MGEETENKAKAYLFEVTALVKNEDGSIGEERQTEFKGYAYTGKPNEAVLDYGRYWDVDDDGCLNLVAEDGKFIGNGLDCCIENACVHGFRGYPIVEKVKELCDTRRWFEFSLGDERKTMLRVTLLDDLPKISREKTIAASDIGPMALHCVKLYGRPLFEDGDTTCAGVTSHPTWVLRTGLANELNAVWESYIASKSGVSVSVKNEPYIMADAICRKLVITAKSRADLDAALKAVGVNNPAEVAPNAVYGNGGVDSDAAAFQAYIILTEKID